MPSEKEKKILVVKSVVKLFNMLSMASSQIIILEIRDYLELSLVICGEWRVTANDYESGGNKRHEILPWWHLLLWKSYMVLHTLQCLLAAALFLAVKGKKMKD